MRRHTVRDTATIIVEVPVDGSRRRRTGKRSGPAQVTVRRVDPLVLEVALQIADGDYRRLQFQADGSVVVINQAR